MNDHDLVTGADPIRCACGRTWPDLSPEKARAAQEAHFRVEQMRKELAEAVAKQEAAKQ